MFPYLPLYPPLQVLRLVANTTHANNDPCDRGEVRGVSIGAPPNRCLIDGKSMQPVHFEVEHRQPGLGADETRRLIQNIK